MNLFIYSWVTTVKACTTIYILKRNVLEEMGQEAFVAYFED